MSMSFFALHDSAALFISPAIAAIINSTGWAIETDDRPNPKGLSQEDFEKIYGDVSEAADRLYSVDCEGLCYLSEFTGEMYPLRSDKILLSTIYEDEYVAYIRSDKEANLFATAYANFDELVTEFKNKMAYFDYEVPEDLIRDNIVEVSGTSCC